MIDPNKVKVMRIRCLSKDFGKTEMDLFKNVYSDKPLIEGYEIYETDTNELHKYDFQEINGRWYIKTGE